MTKEDILKLEEPFILTELKRMGLSVKKKDLNQLLMTEKLKSKKIGRMNIYWKVASESPQSTGLESLTKQLELELEELKRDLMAERQKVRKLSIQEGIDEPWKEVAMAMARILSEQKQVPMREVLEYFNAPLDDY
ncbi:MAG: hypothetical protein ACFE9L_03855 [Candidatus Hodarchaeota archaeon]